ncbi:DegT/DnrJ/EryC1/StrS family aminotransferase [Actinomadura sp. WMMB 499]|uniref:DegT/DnrJ/EryC1/StrS family aminotransferase n=1 Tax=Actinomadura sp. WMMB 499 TaxID=1219491 RepID=UPI00159DBABA|nr:DegT/DnrJ/EryC1/StrS family aminotransferase [Actinomadura sp. WMMB 499]
MTAPPAPTAATAVPFFPPDLFDGDRDALLDAVRTIGTGAAQKFILGEHTARLERALHDRLGAATADVVACSSGTSGLSLLLAALDIGRGDEVVVPAFGCAPLAATVLDAGARPVFADVDPVRLTMDPAAAEAAVGPRTKALMPAHMFSVMADMPAFRALADRHGLHLIEDSALAQGGTLAGRPAGCWGDAGVYSFVQVKTFGMPGEGAVVMTRDAELGRTVRMLRNHGQDGVHRFVHHRIGHNSRFDEVMALFQLHRLPGLDGRLARRAEISARYTRRLAPLAGRGLIAPPAGGDGRFHYVYTLLTERRDELRAHLAERGIAAHVYYPCPLPAQPAFVPHAPRGAAWPNAESATRRNLSLPLYPHLTDAQVDRIADAVHAFADPGTPTGARTGTPTGARTGARSGARSGARADVDAPAGAPSGAPADAPSGGPSDVRTGAPADAPSDVRTGGPSGGPSGGPFGGPSGTPTDIRTPTDIHASTDTGPHTHTER